MEGIARYNLTIVGRGWYPIRGVALFLKAVRRYSLRIVDAVRLEMIEALATGKTLRPS
jgi:hypothetical protein